jgi:hypothetical protein
MRIPVGPPVPIRAMLSARPTTALRRRFPGAFGADLLTGVRRPSTGIALQASVLSEPTDPPELVRPTTTNQNNSLRQTASGVVRISARLPSDPDDQLSHVLGRREDVEKATVKSDPKATSCPRLICPVLRRKQISLASSRDRQLRAHSGHPLVAPDLSTADKALPALARRVGPQSGSRQVHERGCGAISVGRPWAGAPWTQGYLAGA